MGERVLNERRVEHAVASEHDAVWRKLGPIASLQCRPDVVEFFEDVDSEQTPVKSDVNAQPLKFLEDEVQP